MSDRKKPGKNSSRRGRKKPVPTAEEASSSRPIPSPFLRVGFDIGVDISVPPRQNSKDTTAPDATTTTFTLPTPGSNAAASTKKSSSAQAGKRGRANVSNKQALAFEALGLKEDVNPATNKKSKARKAPESTKATKATKAAPATPKKPKKGKTATPPKATPSKRTHDASFPDLSYWSSSKSNVEDNVFESDSDSAAYKNNDRSEYLEHSSDDEDDYLKREREFALGNEVDDDDEYLKYYHGEDTPVKKPRT